MTASTAPRTCEHESGVGVSGGGGGGSTDSRSDVVLWPNESCCSSTSTDYSASHRTIGADLIFSLWQVAADFESFEIKLVLTAHKHRTSGDPLLSL